MPLGPFLSPQLHGWTMEAIFDYLDSDRGFLAIIFGGFILFALMEIFFTWVEHDGGRNEDPR